MKNIDKQKITEKYNVWFIFFIVSVLLILVLNIFSLNIFSRDAEGVAKIYFADNIAQGQEEVIKIFNERNKGRIEIIPINLPFHKFTTNDRKELIARSLRSENTRIDIFAVDLIWGERFAKWAAPLTKYFGESEMENIIPEILQTCTHEGELVGIPQFIDLGVLCYRKDILNKIPGGKEFIQKIKDGVTWDEFIQFGLNNFSDKPFYIFQAKAYEGLICHYNEILASMDGEFDPLNAELLLSEKSISTCRLLYDLINTYKLSPESVLDNTENSSLNLFKNSEAPFSRIWFSNFYKHYQDSLKVEGNQNIDDILGFSDLPKSNKPKVTYGGWNLMISKNCEYKDEAVEFLKFVLSDEVQKILFERSAYLPVVNSVYQDSLFREKHPELPMVEKIKEQGVHRPGIQNYTKVSDILSFHIHKALKGEIDIVVALQTAALIISSNSRFFE